MNAKVITTRRVKKAAGIGIPDPNAGEVSPCGNSLAVQRPGHRKNVRVPACERPQGLSRLNLPTLHNVAGAGGASDLRTVGRPRQLPNGRPVRAEKSPAGREHLR